MSPLRLIAALLVPLMLAACGGDDAESRLRQTLADAEQAVEDRSVLRAAEFIAPDYRDAQGMNKAAVSRLLLGYLHRHRDIHLLTRVRSLQLDAAGRAADVQLLVAMADVPLASAQALSGVSARLYRFDMTFRDGDAGWQLTGARWAPATAGQFLDLGDPG